jgi:hypothetical protein
VLQKVFVFWISLPIIYICHNEDWMEHHCQYSPQQEKQETNCSWDTSAVPEIKRNAWRGKEIQLYKSRVLKIKKRCVNLHIVKFVHIVWGEMVTFRLHAKREEDSNECCSAIVSNEIIYDAHLSVYSLQVSENSRSLKWVEILKNTELLFF